MEFWCEILETFSSVSFLFKFVYFLAFSRIFGQLKQRNVQKMSENLKQTVNEI